MKLNQTIIQLISILTNGGKKAEKFLSLNDKTATLHLEKNPLVKITEESILLLGKEDISQSLLTVPQNKISTCIDFNKLEKFCSEIDIVRLNHLGISYSCSNIDKELDHLKNLLNKTGFELYEEKSENTNQRWFFVGKKENWEYPLFELVFNKGKNKVSTDWIPHFQIDIDTNQSIEELKVLTDKYLGENFFRGELNIPNYGVVLAMGKLANINGTKIYLGLGTNLRGTEYHRKHILVEV